MKIQRNTDGCANKFQPYTIEITIESKKDEQLITALTTANMGVPHAVHNNSEYISQQAVRDLLGDLQLTLRNCRYKELDY